MENNIFKNIFAKTRENLVLNVSRAWERNLEMRFLKVQTRYSKFEIFKTCADDFRDSEFEIFGSKHKVKNQFEIFQGKPEVENQFEIF